MTTHKTSGSAPYTFAYRDDLHTVPAIAQGCEVDLHGGFAIDSRPNMGHIYYGMPGCGILRIDPDLKKQALIDLPDKLKPMNFHSTTIGEFEGKQRLFMPANNDEMVAVMSLDGKLDFVLSRPEFEAYQSADAPYNPTDTALVDNELFIADGYGSNYITSADVTTQEWKSIFGGKTEDATENGKFATAHGISVHHHHHHHLMIADRPSARVQQHGTDGTFHHSHTLPAGAWPCGINTIQHDGRWLSVLGSLRDPVEDRPAPIYIVDADSFEVLSTIRPKDELGIELVQHLHNVIWHVHNGNLFLICQAWNPGYYFVLERVA